MDTKQSIFNHKGIIGS